MTADYFLNIFDENYRNDPRNYNLREIANKMVNDLCFSEGKIYISQFPSEVRRMVSYALFDMAFENLSKIKFSSSKLSSLEHSCCGECGW